MLFTQKYRLTDIIIVNWLKKQFVYNKIRLQTKEIFSTILIGNIAKNLIMILSG